MADTSHRRTDDGQVTVHYDPAIVSQFTLHRADLDLWDAYDRIDCPTLLLRGAESDLLPVSVAQAMAERGPKARVQEFAGFGHAPSLGSSHEYAVIKEFLDA
jgi:pimeloyl-ACP methyl ester carboxylesterase